MTNQHGNPKPLEIDGVSTCDGRKPWPPDVVGRPCDSSAIDWHRRKLATCASCDEERRAYHQAWLHWLEHPLDPSAQPLVSVVIPAYEAGAFISEAVTSCLTQSWVSLEVIVVDQVKLNLRMLGKKTDRRDAYEIARRLR